MLDNLENSMLELPIWIIVPLEVIKKSVDDKYDIEDYQPPLLFLVHDLVLHADQRHDYNVYDKQDLDHIVPLQIPVVLRDDNESTLLDNLVVALLVDTMLFVSAF